MSRNISSQLTQWLEMRLSQTGKPAGDVHTSIPPLDSPVANPVSTRVLAIETITLRITEREVYWAVQAGLKKPILVALQRATGTLWRLFEDGTAIEVMNPHRACVLPLDALFEVEEAMAEHPSIGTSWEVPLFPTCKQDGYSLIQRHRVPQHPEEAHKVH